MPISRTTPTGVTLTLESMTEPNKYETIATLVADRIFDLTGMNTMQRSIGNVDYNQVRDAVAKMLAEGSIKAEVQWA